MQFKTGSFDVRLARSFFVSVLEIAHASLYNLLLVVGVLSFVGSGVVGEILLVGGGGGG